MNIYGGLPVVLWTKKNGDLRVERLHSSDLLRPAAAPVDEQPVLLFSCRVGLPWKATAPSRKAERSLPSSRVGPDVSGDEAAREQKVVRFF